MNNWFGTYKQNQFIDKLIDDRIINENDDEVLFRGKLTASQMIDYLLNLPKKTKDQKNQEQNKIKETMANYSILDTIKQIEAEIKAEKEAK